MSRILDGRALATKIEYQLLETIKPYSQIRAPTLAVLLIGARPDSMSYVRNKQRTATRIGINFCLVEFPADVAESAVMEQINKLNGDPCVDGFILQLPLPSHLDSNKLIQMIDPQKDVDGLCAYNMGLLVSAKHVPHHFPCTPQAILALIDESGAQLLGSHVILVGCGDLVGRPLTLCLLRRGATVTCCHSDTVNIRSIAKMGDIIVAAAGCPSLVKEDWIKPGAIVIDVGINSITQPDGKSRIVGDVDYDNVAKITSAITPVPGGVGPMTVIMLMKAVVKNYIFNITRQC